MKSAFLAGTRFEALMAWMDRIGWAKLQKLALVLLTCVVLLWSVKFVTRAVRKAVDDGNDAVQSDAERRAETLGAVLENAARILVAVFFVLMTLQEFGGNIGPLVAGAGTDYAVFLVSRYHDYLRLGQPSDRAVVRAMTSIGPVTAAGAPPAAGGSAKGWAWGSA